MRRAPTSRAGAPVPEAQVSDASPGVAAGELRDSARAAFRQFVWPVTIVTYDGPTGVTGMTVSSITSLSLDPPAVVLCINRDSRAFRHLRVGTSVGVSLVSSAHRELARRLSTRGIDKTLREDEIDPRVGIDLPPGIRGAVVALAVEITSVTDALSHVVVIAMVRDVHVGTEGVPPLAYYAGQFVEPALLPLERDPAPAPSEPEGSSKSPGAQPVVAVGVLGIPPRPRRRERR